MEGWRVETGDGARLHSTTLSSRKEAEARTSGNTPTSDELKDKHTAARRTNHITPFVQSVDVQEKLFQ